MNRKQFFSLMIGLFFLFGGIFFLVRMTQVENPNSLEELFDFSKQESATVSVEEPETMPQNIETETRAEETTAEEKSELTKMIEWIVEKDIPVWVYLIVFAGIILVIRVVGIYRDVKSYQKTNKNKVGKEG